MGGRGAEGEAEAGRRGALVRRGCGWQTIRKGKDLQSAKNRAWRTGKGGLAGKEAGRAEGGPRLPKDREVDGSALFAFVLCELCWGKPMPPWRVWAVLEGLELRGGDDHLKSRGCGGVGEAVLMEKERRGRRQGEGQCYGGVSIWNEEKDRGKGKGREEARREGAG